VIRFVVNHGATVMLLVLSIIVFGLGSYSTLPREAAPDVKIPVVLVTTPYIGVSPSDIESIVTIPIENEVAGVKDLKKMSSTSAEGASVISLEFEPDVVIEDALQKVRDRVNRVKPTLPEDTEEPEVQEVSFSDFPIIIVNIAGDVDQDLLKELGEDLADDVGRVPGVLNASLSGGLERQIRVQIDPRRLTQHGFSMGDVIGAIGDENVNIPGGEVRAGADSFLLRVPGEFAHPAEIEAVAVKRHGDSPVFVRDLGRVIDGYADASTYARMNQQRSVSLAVTKRAGANIVDINDEVKRLAAEHAETWPEGVSHQSLADQSKFIREMVSDLENNIITALLLVVGVIFFFMGARNSLFVAISIPLSMLMSFAIIQFFGITLNMIVLFSLILALGMLVDNAIVVVENIYRHAEEGKTLKQASIDGTQEVAMAVAASTATTVAAFFPLVFWSGIMGEFMGYLPKTVIIVLVSSLVVAVGILPVATAKLMRIKKVKKVDLLETRNPIMRAYKSLLQLSIRFRYLSALAGGGTLVASFVIYGMLNHGTEFFPSTEPPRATVAVRMPDGTDLETTDAVVRRVEQVMAATENVDIYVAETGVSGGGNPMAGQQALGNVARLTVDFLPDRNNAGPGDQIRVESTYLTIDQLRAAVQTIPGAEISVDQEEMGPPVGADIAVEVSGEDFHTVGELATKVRRRIAEIEGVTDLQDDYRVGRPELRLQVNRAAAKRTGASTRAVANAVRTAVAGAKASTFRDGKDEYDIVVELAPAFRNDLQSILSLRFPGREDTSPDKFSVPISAVAGYELAGGNGSIRHIDQELVVTIEGDVPEGFNANAVRQDVQVLLDELNANPDFMPTGTFLRLGGADDEQQASQEFLGRAFLIAVALILLVLVTQFNGYRLPMIILATVVLSLVGVLWGLLITGTPFGIIMTGLGVISLAGVVVNNAIVLLDYVEQLRERGHDVNDALVRAGMTRFRPVMLTAITTVLGLVPMALGISFDFWNLKLLLGSQSSQMWQSMAVAVIFGLMFATVLTLVLVPTMYSIFEDVERGRRWLVRRVFGGTTAAAAKVLVASVGLSAAGLWVGSAQAATVTLDQALRAAEEANFNLALARENTIQQEALRGQAWSLLSPKVSLGASYTINDEPIEFSMNIDEFIPEEFAEFFDDADAVEPTVIQAKSYLGWNASIVQPLFSGPALPLLRGAYRNVDAARLDESWTRSQLHETVTDAYYGVLIARSARGFAEAGLASSKQHLELADRQVTAGRLPPRAKLQAELGVAQAERQVAVADEAVVGAEQALRLMTGLDTDTELVQPQPVGAPGSLDDAIAKARSGRADVQAADLRVKVAQSQLTAERLGWLPRLDSRFTYSYSENSGFADDPTMWMLVFEASWLMWDGGARLATTRTAQSQLRSSQIMATQMRWLAEQEVHVSWESYDKASAARSAAEREVALATENLRLAEAALAAGSSTWLEVDDARLSLTSAQLAVLQEEANLATAAMALQRATGTP